MTNRRVVGGSINVEILDQDILRFNNDTSPELRLNDGKVLDDYILGIRNSKRHWSIISLAFETAQLGDVPSKYISSVFSIIVPCLTVPIDSTLVISVQYEIVSLDHECQRLILEFKVYSILDPVFNIGSEGQPSMEVKY
jgi:hypothetical protein